MERSIGVKRGVESKCVKKTDMMINNENVGKVTVEGKYAAVRECACSDSVLC